MSRGNWCNDCGMCGALHGEKSGKIGCHGCHFQCEKKSSEDRRPMEERLKAIEYHWNSFSASAKRFLLRHPAKLTIRKFLDFFSQPNEIGIALMSVSIGTAHMLAYEYFNVGAYDNAKVTLSRCRYLFGVTCILLLLHS